MTKDEALKLALEAYLCREMPAGTIIGDPKWWAPKIAAAIKEVLAQPKQEPVGCMPHGWVVNWPSPDGGTKPVYHASSIKPKFGAELDGKLTMYPVYTTPPKREWVGLTEDELVQIGVATGLERAAAQMIESKLKEKNT